MQCYLAGEEIHNETAPETLGPSVYGSAGRNPEGDIIVRLVNASPLNQTVNVEMAGAAATVTRALLLR